MSTFCPTRSSVESRRVDFGTDGVGAATVAATTIPAAQFDLPADLLLPIDPRPGMTIRAIDGEVWVTQAGRAEDVVLATGDSFTPAPRGRVVVQALTDARVGITGVLGA